MTDNTKMREAFVQACKEYGPTISFGDFECGWDACMAWQAARTVPEGFVMVPVEMLDRFPELNEFNYSHDDVCELNAWGIDLVLSAAQKEEIEISA